MSIRKNWATCNCLMIAGSLFCFSLISSAADGNVSFQGVLVSKPCQLDTESENISVYFGDIVNKYIYLNKRTRGKTLEIKLTNCNVAVQRSVKAKFIGKENSQLPGLLAVSNNTATSGFAIGIEMYDGSPIILNQSKIIQKLTSNEELLSFKAYVQGEPTAIDARNIELGDFTATATFELEYE